MADLAMHKLPIILQNKNFLFQEKAPSLWTTEGKKSTSEKLFPSGATKAVNYPGENLSFEVQTNVDFNQLETAILFLGSIW